MKAPKYFVGIDVSKLTMDVAVVVQDGRVVDHLKIENTKASIIALFRKLKLAHSCNKTNLFVCAENMGIYNTFLCEVCQKRKLIICLESALQIKRSLGIQRGKNDALDAIRIGQYARKNFESLRHWEPPRPVIIQLKALIKIRSKIKKIKQALLKDKKDNTYFLSKPKQNSIKQYSASIVAAMNDELKRVELEMDELVDRDENLKHLMELVTSVPYISKVIAREFIIHTNEFRDGRTARQFATYCGIAPFEWTSGTSIRGKSRISVFGNREMKALIHIAAMGTLRLKKTFLYNYYERKVKEGKNKMSVLNAIRNKLVHRVFACVRDNKFHAEPA